MRLPDEQEERGMGMPVIYTLVAVSAFVLFILVVVYVSNRSASDSGSRARQLLTATPSPTAEKKAGHSEGQDDIETLYREHRLRSEDLDFWDMYGGGGTDVIIEKPEATPDASMAPYVSASPGTAASPEPTVSPEPVELTDEEKAADGKHTLVTYRDGTQEWVEILETLPANAYDFTNLKSTNGQMAYYQNGEKVSKLGVDLSQNNGNIDFPALKTGGVDFVMLRLGARGYESGLLSLDDNFMSNITAAAEAGLEIGVIFSSQAVTVQEARGEADFVINSLTSYKISYPVALEFNIIANDDARTDILDAEDRTQIAETFLDTIERAGYYSILYGNKDQLLGDLEEEQLFKEYDVWLNDPASVPDYPYQFKMWKYAREQKVPGVTGYADYTISFIDYTRR